MEIWKDIVEYEGLYQVSNLGNVKSLHDRYGNYRERLLKPIKRKDNYLCVDLHKNGKRKTYLVHRLVAETFLTKIDGKNHVDHINSDRQNNNVNNLRWCNQKENNQFDLARKHKSEAAKGKTGAWKGKTGTLHPSSKAVLCIELNKIFGSAMEAGRETGIKQQNISKCCNGKLQSAGKHPVTGEKLHWKYAK